MSVYVRGLRRLLDVAHVVAFFALVVTVGALCVDCALGPFHEYEIEVDASFSAEDIAAITSALDEWTQRTAAAATPGGEGVDGVGFHLSIVNGPPKLPRNGVYFRPSDAQGMCFDRDMKAMHVAGYTFNDLGGFIECVQYKYATDPVERDKFFRTIVLHETGHVLGLRHDVPPSVMTPSIGDAAPHLTDRDVAQWCAVSGWC